MSARASPGGVLLLDKPAGITSTRALAMARRALGASRGGHTGTLDPFATGLLPLVFGEATKFSRFLIDSTKAYEATLRLGFETETGDTESDPQWISDDLPDLQEIAANLPMFSGDIEQIPPMHSAVWVAGKRLYEHARQGRVVPRQPRQVHVSRLEIRKLEGRMLEISVTCSKGTYIRVLAADLGRALGCGAYLTALRRTAVGEFDVSQASTPEDLAQMGAEAARQRLLPVEALVAGLPRVEVDATTATRFGHGQAVPAAAPLGPGPVAVFGGERFLGVGESQADRIAPLRLLAEAPESPDFA